MIVSHIPYGFVMELLKSYTAENKLNRIVAYFRHFKAVFVQKIEHINFNLPLRSSDLRYWCAVGSHWKAYSQVRCSSKSTPLPASNHPDAATGNIKLWDYMLKVDVFTLEFLGGSCRHLGCCYHHHNQRFESQRAFILSQMCSGLQQIKHIKQSCFLKADVERETSCK